MALNQEHLYQATDAVKTIMAQVDHTADIRALEESLKTKIVSVSAA
jgi:hypothetical protein